MQTFRAAGCPAKFSILLLGAITVVEPLDENEQLLTDSDDICNSVGKEDWDGMADLLSADPSRYKIQVSRQKLGHNHPLTSKSWSYLSKSARLRT